MEFGNFGYTNREKKLIAYLKKQTLSPSHGLDHLEKVARDGMWMAGKYRVNRELVVAAALLHDLGRSNINWRGKESAVKGANLAKSFLKKAGYLDEERKLICQIIAEHDQPNFKSNLVESRILKEVDFLDGFGARGILRSLTYAGETGGGVEEAVQRMKKKAYTRVKSLEFVEIKRLAWKRFRLMEAFLSELEAIETLETVDYEGYFIVLEGISGCGKDTQAKLLAEHLRKLGKKVKVVNHPTEFLKHLWRQWKVEVDERVSETFLLLADRFRMVKHQIIPALRRGEVVISSRSSITAQVYQSSNEMVAEWQRVYFGFEPVADVVVYLDVSGEVALGRADKRVKEGKETNRGFFPYKQELQKKNYDLILERYPDVVRVNADGDVVEVAKLVWMAVNRTLHIKPYEFL